MGYLCQGAHSSKGKVVLCQGRHIAGEGCPLLRVAHFGASPFLSEPQNVIFKKVGFSFLGARSFIVQRDRVTYITGIQFDLVIEGRGRLPMSKALVAGNAQTIF